MKKDRIIAPLLLAVLIAGCNKLEEKPKQSLVVPATLQDYQGLMDNTDKMNANYPIIGEISANEFYMTQSRFDAIIAIQHKRAFKWEKQLFTGVSEELDWDSQYQKVFYANIVLDGIDKVKGPGSRSEIYNVKGQALVHRASAHFALAQQFAKPFDKVTASTDPGIPIRLNSDLNIPVNRGTLAATYDQIIKDLVSAKALLPSTPAYKTRPSKPAVYGLLARVYLIKGDYQNAYLNADSCLQLYSQLLDYNSISGAVSFPFPRLNNEVIFDLSFSISVLRYDRAIIYSDLYNQYQTNDLRKILFFVSNGTGTYGFRGHYTGGQSPYFCGIATDEQYLIKAECQARMDKKDDALETINTLLATRYKTGTYVPITAVNAEEALAVILKERRKELLFRGLRWMDLRRLNQDPRFAVNLTRTLGEDTYTLPANDSKYTMQIPDYIVSINDIPQNP